MLRLDEKTNTIEIVEQLSFEHTVQPILTELIDELEYSYEELDENETYTSYEGEEYSKQILGLLITYLQNNMGPDDKNEILQLIMDEYENDFQYSYDNASIFDEDFIQKQLKLWIEEKLTEIDVD